MNKGNRNQNMPSSLIELLNSLEAFSAREAKFKETGICDCPSCTAEREVEKKFNKAENPNPPKEYSQSFGFSYNMVPRAPYGRSGQAEIKMNMECDQDDAATVLSSVMALDPIIKGIVLNAVRQFQGSFFK